MSAEGLLVNARVEAVFASDLTTGAEVDRTGCDAAIRAAVQTNGGVRGCLEQLAAEYGEHPETAVPRSQWARHLVEQIYGSPARTTALNRFAWRIDLPSATDTIHSTRGKM